MDSGFHSDNYLIETSKQKYALKIFHEREKNIIYILRVFEHLAKNDIKTARPIRTKDNNLYLKFNGQIIGIQRFIEGKPKKLIKSLIPVYGKELGKMQKALFSLRLDGREDFECLKILKNLAKKYMPKDDYVKTKYNLLEKDLKEIKLRKLTKAIINADCGPQDFFFQDSKFTGILDFGDSHLDYILYEIATFIMYSKIYPDTKEYKIFIDAYLKEFPRMKKEIKYVDIFFKVRLFIQILYHWYRYKEKITQGVNKNSDNLQGVKHGKKALEKLEKRLK